MSSNNTSLFPPNSSGGNSEHKHSGRCSGVHRWSDLEDGVLLVRHGRVTRRMFPGDLEESVVWTEPMQTGIPAAVHLSQQPGLQTDPPGLDTHGGALGVLGGDWKL